MLPLAVKVEGSKAVDMEYKKMSSKKSLTLNTVPAAFRLSPSMATGPESTALDVTVGVLFNVYSDPPENVTLCTRVEVATHNWFPSTHCTPLMALVPILPSPARSKVLVSEDVAISKAEVSVTSLRIVPVSLWKTTFNPEGLISIVARFTPENAGDCFVVSTAVDIRYGVDKLNCLILSLLPSRYNNDPSLLTHGA
jgi:hypothetical protein